MCGIFGCISDDAATSVLEGLRKLEYRGYDSAGLAAIFDLKNGQIETERTTGYVSIWFPRPMVGSKMRRYRSVTLGGPLMEV